MAIEQDEILKERMGELGRALCPYKTADEAFDEWWNRSLFHRDTDDQQLEAVQGAYGAGVALGAKFPHLAAELLADEAAQQMVANYRAAVESSGEPHSS